MLENIFYVVGGVFCILILAVIGSAIVYMLYLVLFDLMIRKTKEYNIVVSYWNLIKTRKKNKDEKSWYRMRNELGEIIKKYKDNPPS